MVFFKLFGVIPPGFLHQRISLWEEVQIYDMLKTAFSA